MKIGPFVNYIKWPGELGSIGCVFIACSLPFVCLIRRDHVSKAIHFIFPVESKLFLSSSSMFCGTNMAKVELQDDHCSVSTLQSSE